jgi:hypothetical protein
LGISLKRFQEKKPEDQIRDLKEKTSVLLAQILDNKI